MKTLSRFQRSYLWYSFKRDPLVVVSFTVLAALAAVALLAPADGFGRGERSGLPRCARRPIVNKIEPAL